jgi:drug/metabolite transporter (DMT)-like permease
LGEEIHRFYLTQKLLCGIRMKKKWMLFAGIILLVAGIVLRNLTELDLTAVLLIVLGVLFKTYYIVRMARSGEYKPGYELYFLFAGLGMFLSGLYLKSQNPSVIAGLLVFTGILLKTSFIVIFIVRLRAARKRK